MDYFVKEFIIQEIEKYIPFDMHNLFNTSNNIQFKEFKTQYIYLKMNQDFSLKYCSSDIYIKNKGLEEIEINTGITFHNYINLQYKKLNNRLSININNRTITNVMNMYNIHTLNLVNCSLEDVGSLGNTHTLNLSKSRSGYEMYNSYEEDYTPIQRRRYIHNPGRGLPFKGVEYLGKVYSLNLSYTDISDEDIKHLGKCHTLIISNNEKITDKGIKHLGKVHILDLKNCNKITDEGLKYLEKAHTLDVTNCNKITDEGLKYLEKVHTLDLERTHITDEGVKYLGKVHTLNLSGCKKITDEGVKYLGKVHTLNLSGCNKITDEGVKYLGKVHILNISHCDFITDEGVKFLGNCHTLNVCGLDITEKSIKYLSNCDTLHLGRCGKLPNGMYALFRGFGVNYYPECTTINDNDLKYISTCATIHLRGCSNITNIGISHLGNIETLKLYDCKKLIIEGFVGTERCQSHNII